MVDYNMFKQAIRGFDKDEVLDYITSEQEKNEKRIASLERDVRKRDRIISELKNRIVLKDEQVDRLEKEISTKYQKYIDNYRQIGDLVYESKLKGDRIIEDAHTEADRIMAEADQEAKHRLQSVQGEVDAKLTDGKQKYLAVQDEMNEIVDMFNQMQKKFMQSYKEVHEIIQSMPASLDDMDLGIVDDNDLDEEDLDDMDLELTSLGIHFDEDPEDADEFDEEFRSEMSTDSEADTEAQDGGAESAERADGGAWDTEQTDGGAKDAPLPGSTKTDAAPGHTDAFEGTNAEELLSGEASDL